MAAPAVAALLASRLMRPPSLTRGSVKAGCDATRSLYGSIFSSSFEGKAAIFPSTFSHEKNKNKRRSNNSIIGYSRNSSGDGGHTFVCGMVFKQRSNTKSLITAAGNVRKQTFQNILASQRRSEELRLLRPATDASRRCVARTQSAAKQPWKNHSGTCHRCNLTLACQRLREHLPKN